MLENPWKVGRYQIAREWSAGNFEALLERIEWASLGWEDGEHIAGPGAWLGEDPKVARASEDRFVASESWYAAAAEQSLRPRGRK